MKNVIKFLFLLIVFNIFLIKVVAAVYDCEYSYTENGGYVQKITIQYDTSQGTYKNLNIKKDGFNYSYTYSYQFYENEIKSLKSKEDGNDKNECPILYLTENSYTPQGGIFTYYTYKFYSDGWIRQQENGYNCINSKTNMCLNNLFGEFTHFYELTLSTSNTNVDNENLSKCQSYYDLFEKIKANYSSYKNCEKSLCKEYINEANNNIQKIKDYCNKSFDYRDKYIQTQDGELIEDPCISSCLNFEKELNSLKKKYEIGNYGNNECGLSDRLISFIANLLKWVKFVIPVLVIIFGILDFIKAVGADKDDEMKKAQGKFAKRLIAAALIFIVPFILEFILNKMGFITEGCGILEF